MLKEAIIQNNEDTFASREEINDFLNQVAVHTALQTGEMPSMETNRKIVEHFNRSPQAVKGFEEAGYFVYAGVKVYEQGKRKAAEDRDNLDMEQKIFGAKK